MNTFFPQASGVMINGGTFIAANIGQSKRGIDILMESIASDALHDSADQYDVPKCHPHTRVAVVDDIMEWVIKAEVQDEFMMWLFGPAGAGKTAIARKIAELAAEKGVLIGTFFFSRTSPTRNSIDRLIPTLGYQMTVSIPGTRAHIEAAIEKDLAIFKKNLQTQIGVLLMKPFQSVSTDSIRCPKLIIIDGLDECTNRQAQVAILDAISCSFTAHKLPIRCLVVSRPEAHLITPFNRNEALRSTHRRLALDNGYRPDDDIHLFFSDKFEQIRCTHRLRSTVPTPWPTEQSLDALVQKSSGQFIFAATVIRFVESDRHRPAARLNIILGISPPGTINPFTELDALYTQILSSVDDIQLTLRVLSLYILLPNLARRLEIVISLTEQFLSLEEGDIDRALIDLSSLVSYNEISGEVKILHASMVDFLSDPRRSDKFYIMIDMANACTDFACRTFQCVKGPDGILAGDLDVLQWGINEEHWILTDQLRNEILNFDLDAFIAAFINLTRTLEWSLYDIIWIFEVWRPKIPKMGLESDDEQLLTDRWMNSLESRIQKYKSHWQLQLLLTLVLSMPTSPTAKYLDILLEMYDENLHRIDRDALDLRHARAMYFASTVTMADISPLKAMISRYFDDDRYASAALRCIRFLSNPPQYLDRNGSLETGITHNEWKRTSEMALNLLPSLLLRAKTSPEILQYMNDHDIHTMVQKYCPVIDIWEVDTCILAFLSRGGVCVNWRIISAIQRGLSPTNKSAAAKLHSESESIHQQSPIFGENGP